MALTLKQAHLETLKKITEDHVDDLASGSADSYDDYRYKVGVVEGIRIAQREFLDITERIERDR